MAPNRVERKLTAILSADVAGYSRLMGDDEEATLQTLKSYRKVFSEYIARYGGRVINAPGDALLADFPTVTDAVRCAVEIQRELAEKNAELPDDRRMDFRIGINLGEVMVEEDAIYGDGVNIAARLDSLAEPGGICVSGTVHDSIQGKLNLEYQYLGEKSVKNIKQPVRTYRVLSHPGAAAHRVMRAKRMISRTWRKGALAAALIALIGGAALAAWFLYLRPIQEPAELASGDTSALELPDKPSIAVLPFVNMSGDPEQEYFSDGITEDIITGLSRFSELFVIARNSTFQYKGKSVDVRQVGRDLGVRYVLEGSVRKAENQVRITAQLIEAATGQHLWVERYDRELKHVFAVQDEITEQIVGRLGVQLEREDLERAKRKPPEDMEAYDLVLRARRLIQVEHSEKNDAQARELLERAVELDPQLAAAYSELAWIYLNEWRFGWNPRPNPLDRALKAAQRGVDLDPDNGFAHWRLAKIHFFRKELVRFEAETEKALALNPNHAETTADIGIHLCWIDRLEECYELTKRAMRLDPHYPTWLHFATTIYHYLNGRYEEALTEVLQIKMPDLFWTHALLAAVYGQLGMEKKARAAAAETLRLKPDFIMREELRKFNYPEYNIDKFVEGARKAGLP